MNVKEIKEILDRYETGPKKKFGQNFLIDENALEKIVDISCIDKLTNVIEIGPGLGALTTHLVKKAKSVLCYEIDEDMVNYLTDKFKNNNNIRILQSDFLKVNINKDINDYFNNEDVVVVANLPYYITTAILIKIFEETKKIKSLTVMMQQEVAKRICGKPSTKDYNSLSVLIQYYTTTKLAFLVKPHSFYPEPGVDSAVVYIKYGKENSHLPINEEFFLQFNRIIFTQRRKTLANNLKEGFGYTKELIEKILLENNLNLNVRSEMLSVDQIIDLSNAFYKK